MSNQSKGEHRERFPWEMGKSDRSNVASVDDSSPGVHITREYEVPMGSSQGASRVTLRLSEDQEQKLERSNELRRLVIEFDVPMEMDYTMVKNFVHQLTQMLMGFKSNMRIAGWHSS